MNNEASYDPFAESRKGKVNAEKVMDEFCDVGVAFRHSTLGVSGLKQKL